MCMAICDMSRLYSLPWSYVHSVTLKGIKFARWLMDGKQLQNKKDMNASAFSVLKLCFHDTETCWKHSFCMIMFISASHQYDMNIVNPHIEVQYILTLTRKVFFWSVESCIMVVKTIGCKSTWQWYIHCYMAFLQFREHSS